MLPKLIRSFGSSIEEGIFASFSDVALGDKSFIERNVWDNIRVVWRNMAKRGVDLLLSSILLSISMPLFLSIAIVIKIYSKGPVFFRQERVGYCGKIFHIWKFRTMQQESSEEEHREYVRYLLKEGNKAKNRVDLLTKYINYVDGKTTNVGRFLRTTSLDELPQLINILVGDMSFVGPRPHPVYEVDEYKKWYRRRLNVKPGLTGWSKLSLRCTPKNYEEAILYDLWYVDNWSLRLDLRIILMTIPFVLFMKEAH